MNSLEDQRAVTIQTGPEVSTFRSTIPLNHHYAPLNREGALPSDLCKLKAVSMEAYTHLTTRVMGLDSRAMSLRCAFTGPQEPVTRVKHTMMTTMMTTMMILDLCTASSHGGEARFSYSYIARMLQKRVRATTVIRSRVGAGMQERRCEIKQTFAAVK